MRRHYGEGKAGETQFLRDWAEYDQRYSKAMTRQIFPNHIYKEEKIWDRR